MSEIILDQDFWVHTFGLCSKCVLKKITTVIQQYVIQYIYKTSFDYRVATLPGNLEFDNLGKNNLEKPGIFNNFNIFSNKISIWHKYLSFK